MYAYTWVYKNIHLCAVMYNKNNIKQVMNLRGGSWGTWAKLEGRGELEVLQIQCIHIQY